MPISQAAACQRAGRSGARRRNRRRVGTAAARPAANGARVTRRSTIRTCRSTRRTSPASGRRTASASAAAGAAAIAAIAASATSFRCSRRTGRPRSTRNIPSYGRALGSADAEAHPEEHIGRRRAQPPALGNDLYQQCNPMGMPRAILYPDPVEFIVLPDRILQHFQWGYGLRTIWMDGRTLPKPDEVDIARWWGYAVGRWEGNTLVVDVDRLRRAHLGRSLRLSAQRHDGARGALHAHQLRHARADDDVDGSRRTTRSRGCRRRSACT